MGNPMPQHLAAHRKCGAYSRTTGAPCRQPAMPNGRCKMHGGKAGRRQTHGRYARTTIEAMREISAMARSLGKLVRAT